MFESLTYGHLSKILVGSNQMLITACNHAERNWHRTEKAVLNYSKVQKKSLAVHSILKSLSSNHFKGLSLTNKMIWLFSFVWRAITTLDCNPHYLLKMKIAIWQVVKIAAYGSNFYF